MFCHKIICKKHFIVKNFDRGHECILPMNILFFNIVLNTFLALISYTPQGLPLHPLESNLLGPGISILNLFSLWGIPLISWLSEGFEKGSLRQDPRPMPTSCDCGCKMGRGRGKLLRWCKDDPQHRISLQQSSLLFLPRSPVPILLSHKIDILISFREPALT